MTRPQLIDAWIQPWPAEAATAIPPHRRNTHIQRKFNPDDRKARAIPNATLIAEMDEAGVDFALLSGGPAVPMPAVLELLDKYPERFAGVAWTDPTQGIVAAQRELEHLARNYNIVGYKLEPFLLWKDPVDRVFYPMYAKCAELDITLQTQVGGCMPLYPSRTGHPMFIDEIALDFPELRIVCGHVGGPWVDEMIHVAWKHENVWIDTSARLPRLFEPEFLKFLRSYGSDTCIFASDWPILDFRRPVSQLDALELSPEVRDKFCSANAAKAFKLTF